MARFTGPVLVDTNNPIDPALFSGMGDSFLEPRDERDRVLDLVLGVRRKRPVRQVEPPPHRVDRHVEFEQEVVGCVTEEGEPALAHHHRVELVTVQNQQPPSIGGVVDRRTPDLDPAEVHSGKLAKHLIVVAGDVNDTGPALGLLHQPADDGIMAFGPEESLLHPPAVDDVTDEVERVAVAVVKEIDQEPAIAAARAEMDVRNPDRPIAPACRAGRADRPVGFGQSLVANAGGRAGKSAVNRV